MVYIPGGRVDIGAPEPHLDDIASQQHYGRTWFEDEAPQHTRAISAYYIDRTPVTNAQYAAFVDATGHVTRAERRGFGLVYGPTFWLQQPGTCWRTPALGVDAVAERPDHPVVHVDHADATAYASWARKRLPTEPEWEYAAHGPRWSPWPWGEQWDPARANSAEFWAGPLSDLDGWRRWWMRRYAVDGPAPSTTVVGQFSPAGDSPFGVADMSGNIAEWTASTYDPYDPHRSYDPAFAAAMRYRYRVVRGGSWKHFRFQTRTTERIACLPDYNCFDIGFRCVADPNHDEG
ncbi:formylglycine-generating enzyme family protein [Nocardia pneumoniae]|uniref:formylglycine-generating enzyme family protein n=1 Tax=Nocardia pneumoniae TaxID=228601 RepID=UPI0002D30656|nr:SUMF1/EgtB/PvdO family nonheme iron enzyme [Nocardia pneumoniae]